MKLKSFEIYITILQLKKYIEIRENSHFKLKKKKTILNRNKYLFKKLKF